MAIARDYLVTESTLQIVKVIKLRLPYGDPPRTLSIDVFDTVTAHRLELARLAPSFYFFR